MTEADVGEFFTWVPQSYTCGGQGIQVTGWFAYMSVIYTETDTGKRHPSMKIHYLTPHDSPMRMMLPAWLLKGKSPDQICAADIVELMKIVFTKEFRDIPPVPISIPIEKIPPHKREQMREMLRKRF
jgi:hypothetical protein